MVMKYEITQMPGSIEKVEVYPSQFGKEQMAKEREKGPAIKAKERVEEEEGEDGSKEFNSDALRKYQVTWWWPVYDLRLILFNLISLSRLQLHFICTLSKEQFKLFKPFPRRIPNMITTPKFPNIPSCSRSSD